MDVVRLLVQIGTSLKKAHAVLETMARGFSATIEAESNDMDALTKGLSALGVEAQPLRIPEVAVRDVRARLGLSQADFALRFGFEKDTIQNWEQGRSRLDAVSRMLLAIIERSPEVVDAVQSSLPSGATPSARRASINDPGQQRSFP